MDLSQVNIRALSKMLQDPDTRSTAADEFKKNFLQLLDLFIPSPLEFRSLLVNTHSIITGEAAVWFAMRAGNEMKPMVMDVFCPSYSFEDVQRFFMNLPNTTWTTSLDDTLETSMQQDELHGRRRYYIAKTEKGTIRVTQSVSYSAFHTVPFQEATHLMNVLTPHIFISPYPTLTLNKMTIATSHDSHTRQCDNVYKKGEFIWHTHAATLSNLSFTCYSFPACPRRDRSFLDAQCLVIQFDLTERDEVREMLDNARYTYWRLGGRGCGNDRCFLPVQKRVSSEDCFYERGEDEEVVLDTETGGVDEGVADMAKKTLEDDDDALPDGGEPYVDRRLDGCSRLCNELLFMVLSYCDITTLLFLYDDPVWHHLVVDILRKSHGELLRTSEIKGASFDGVIGHILTLNFEERIKADTKSKILPYCEMFTLVKLRQCRSWHGAVIIELNRSYNASLSPFTTDPSTFRDILRRTGSLASGSAALWFLLRMPDSWTPADMDIMTPRLAYDQVVGLVGDLIGSQARITYSRRLHGDPGPYTRRCTIETAKIRVDIMESETESPFSVMMSYWSTHTMNGFMADSFWSAYPSLTLRGMGLDNYCDTGGCLSASRANALDRGFTLFKEGDNVQFVDPKGDCGGFCACPNRNRYMGDDMTLKLSMLNETDEEFVQSLVGSYTVGWRLGWNPCGSSRCFMPGELETYCLQWVA